MKAQSLDYFNAIATWGKQTNYSNTNYFVKFRFTREIARLVAHNFKKRYPNLELQYYVTKKNMVLLGGEFHKDSGVAEAIVSLSKQAKEHLSKELAS